MKLFNYFTEKDKNIWTKLSSLGQEPTFKLLDKVLKRTLFAINAIVQILTPSICELERQNKMEYQVMDLGKCAFPIVILYDSLTDGLLNYKKW